MLRTTPRIKSPLVLLLIAQRLVSFGRLLEAPTRDFSRFRQLRVPTINSKVKRGLWSAEEDVKLIRYVTTYGYGCWSEVPDKAGLQRCGKSCRLRWVNYLRPDIRRGKFTQEEEMLIISLHEVVGNRWTHIASQLPGRTDNDIKNYWNTWIKKRLRKPGSRMLQQQQHLTNTLQDDQTLTNAPEQYSRHYELLNCNPIVPSSISSFDNLSGAAKPSTTLDVRYNHQQEPCSLPFPSIKDGASSLFMLDTTGSLMISHTNSTTSAQHLHYTPSGTNTNSDQAWRFIGNNNQVQGVFLPTGVENEGIFEWGLSKNDFMPTVAEDGDLHRLAYDQWVEKKLDGPRKKQGYNINNNDNDDLLLWDVSQCYPNILSRDNAEVVEAKRNNGG